MAGPIAQIDSATQSLNDYAKSLGNVGTGSGPLARIEGKAKSALGQVGLNKNAAVTNDTLDATASAIGNVLGIKDINQARALLPSTTSTTGEAVQKFQQLRQLLAQRRQALTTIPQTQNLSVVPSDPSMMTFGAQGQ